VIAVHLHLLVDVRKMFGAVTQWNKPKLTDDSYRTVRGPGLATVCVIYDTAVTKG